MAKPTVCDDAAPDLPGHTCGLIDAGPVVRAAHGWAGPLADGHLHQGGDVAAIQADGLFGWAGPGSPFAVAHAILEAHADVHDRMTERLAAEGELSYGDCKAMLPWHTHPDWPDWAAG